MVCSGPYVIYLIVEILKLFRIARNETGLFCNLCFVVLLLVLLWFYILYERVWILQLVVIEMKRIRRANNIELQWHSPRLNDHFRLADTIWEILWSNRDIKLTITNLLVACQLHLPLCSWWTLGRVDANFRAIAGTRTNSLCISDAYGGGWYGIL